MKKNYYALFFLPALFTVSQMVQGQEGIPPKQKVAVSMVASSSVGKTHPFEVFSPDTVPWEANPSDNFVKLHIYFDEPEQVAGVEIKPCQTTASRKASITVYVNFDELSDRIPAGVWHYNFPQMMATRSITLNFNMNTQVCVSEVIIYGSGLNEMVVQAPQIVRGQALASSTLSPENSYNIMNLFDSRFEYGWASNKKASGDALTFQFDQPQKIDKLLLWNGYQRSDVHCASNSRAKKIKLSGDGGYEAIVDIKDVMGSQQVALPKPFEGKNLKMTMEESFAGKKYPDLVLSELRFGNGSSWFMLDPKNFLDQIANGNQTAFQKAELTNILGKGLAGESYHVAGTKAKEEFWKFRFRADGSFYIDGGGGIVGKEMGDKFYAIGNYEIVEETLKGVKLRIFGLLKKQKFEWGGDCNGCGRDCNQAQNKDESQKIFQDFVLLSKTAEGVSIKNVGEVKNIPFSQMVLKEQNYIDYGE